ncbi:hypothetical protein [Kitasatospora viridis]|uniref:hypothetical protein n=1 Tax=Kitasatospora viridis TaxID=281105 RepID=UPI0011A49C2B|nr:hypothetical protein [Kitasatospora viridis]
MPEGSWWDWEVVEWIPGRLRFGAGYDLTYHHELELVFSDPMYVACPSAFHDPEFREPTAEELALMVRQVGELPPVLVAFEADAGGSGPATGLIAAEQVRVVQGSWSHVVQGGRSAPATQAGDRQEQQACEPGQ